MTAPMGWYPDPSGMPMRRFFDGVEWTADYAPLHTPSNSPPGILKKLSPRLFQSMAVGGVIVAVITFILMQFAFSSPALWSDISAVALFIGWLLSLAVAGVGVIGIVVRLIRRRR